MNRLMLMLTLILHFQLYLLTTYKSPFPKSASKPRQPERGNLVQQHDPDPVLYLYRSERMPYRKSATRILREGMRSGG